MAELSDKDIVKKIKNGEIDYYSYIVKKYTTSIYRYIERKLFKKDEADDLVQNVFISFYKAIEKFDEEKPIKPYLFQIVQNELKMYFRSYKKSLPLDERIVSEDKQAELKIEDFKLLNSQERGILKHISEGYSYEEIAKVVKKPLNTIKSIVRRGRLKIKKIYL
ncbi:MAG: RNA polymerase sigma factor [Candidatus Roizmanbacteria bacterium]|nr:RNA polymerase sigma factor [Candidatus Roizmanbacteria bacterium]